MQITQPSTHPLVRMNHHLLSCGDRGISPWGRITDVGFEYDADIRVWWLSFDTTLSMGLGVESLLIYLYADGKLIDKLVPDSPYPYRPEPFSNRVSLKAYLAPAHSYFETLGYARFYAIKDRVELTWTQVDGAESMEIYGDTSSSPTTLLKELSIPVPSLVNTAGSLSGCVASVAGSWNLEEDSEDGGPSFKYTTIALTALDTGYSSQGIDLAWVWADGDVSGTITTGENGYAPILNGIFISFDPSTAIQSGDQWTIKIQLPTTFTSLSLRDGTYSFKVKAVNKMGLGNSTTISSIDIDTPPLPPELLSYSVSGSSLTVNLSIPSSDSSLEFVNTYHNRDWLGDKLVHHRRIAQTTVSLGTTVSLTYNSLNDGYHRFVFKGCDGNGRESEDVTVEFDLTSGEEDPIMPEPPLSISAQFLESGLVLVSVEADRLCPSVRLYGGVGTISYTAPLTTIPNPMNEDYETLTALLDLSPDGQWVLGARGYNNGVEESNTDVVTLVWVLKATPAAPTGLTAEVVE